jgi:hypothetical protein
MTLTVAAVRADGRTYEHAADLGARAAEIKLHSKQKARSGERGVGSCVAWERRGAQ